MLQLYRHDEIMCHVGILVDCTLLIAQALFSRFRRSLVWVAPIANFYLFDLEPKPAMNKQIKQKS